MGVECKRTGTVTGKCTCGDPTCGGVNVLWDEGHNTNLVNYVLEILPDRPMTATEVAIRQRYDFQKIVDDPGAWISGCTFWGSHNEPKMRYVPAAVPGSNKKEVAP
jgi:hypothetical protein